MPWRGIYASRVAGLRSRRGEDDAYWNSFDDEEDEEDYEDEDDQY